MQPTFKNFLVPAGDRPARRLFFVPHASLLLVPIVASRILPRLPPRRVAYDSVLDRRFPPPVTALASVG
ncbi:hypothetical protein FJTKL_12258 [Diaporthe vaccinii]|uniref:Uncharacterized protein n=1 Tax=Diaporthe vaccinii TaxID=105482 RepID=A0ABR4EE51_9PEZI